MIGKAKLSHLALLLVLLSSSLFACSGREGTISVSILSSPESEILSQIQRLEASLVSLDGSELERFEGSRSTQGTLAIDIEFTAGESSGYLNVRGYDENDDQIAFGRVGPLPLSAIDANVAVFLAPPLSISQAPIALDEPLSHIGSTTASFGVFLAGGKNAEGPVNQVSVYSSYLHTMQEGLPMPVALSEPTLVPGGSGTVYMVGGIDSEQAPSNVALAFDTTAPPAGSYRAMIMAPEHARVGAVAAVVGQEQYLLSGDPALLLDGFQNTLRALSDGDMLSGPAHTLVTNNSLQVIFAGAEVGSGAALYEAGQVTRLSPPPEMNRIDHQGIALANGEILYLGGAIDDVATRGAVLYKTESRSFQTIELLATARRNPAVARTGDYLVVVGGEDDTGKALGDVEVFDAVTLAPVAVLPLQVARKNTTANALNNGQVLIAGGLDAEGNPSAILELFTPDR